jgi:hypothetical protein
MIWQPLRIGGGGYVTGIDFSADGSTLVARTDTYGAYIWHQQINLWQQLVTTNSMPANDIKIENNAGVYEIRVAPTLPNRLYMAYRGRVYRSDNSGIRWTRTSFADVAMDANDSFRGYGQKMAIDPNNPDIAYMGTPKNGLFVTTDGGASWQSVSGVPVSTKDSKGNYPGISGIEFDPALGVTGGKTNTIFAASYGNGVYESTNGGASWSSIGGPTDVVAAAVSSTGVYYVAADNSSVWSYANGTWTQLLNAPGKIWTIAVDPANPNEIVAQDSDGSLAVSYDAGATWNGLNIGLAQFNSTDIPWLAKTGEYMTAGGLAFNPAVPNELFSSDGVGVWHTNFPTSGFTWQTVTLWTDQSAGIEQLVANDIIAPPGGVPILASWDRGFMTITNPNAYPTSYGPVNGSFVAGWSLDYASSDPSFIVGLANWWGTEESGYSTDGGQTWKQFRTYPPVATNGKIGGDIAVSTPKNVVWSPSNNSPPYFSQDGGVTWKPIIIDGVPMTGETGWGWAYYLNRHIVTADRVTAGTFYIYNYLKGLYRSTDGGGSWKLAYSGPIGPWSTFHARLRSVPDHAGDLFFTSGPQAGDHPATTPFMHSTDGGSTWSAVPDVLEVRTFAFGKGLKDYPAIFIVGWVDHTYGIWRSDDGAKTWTQIGEFPSESLDNITTIEGDKSTFGKVYIGFSGSGYAYAVLSK